VGLIFLIPLHRPPRKLNDIQHQRHHDSNLKSVEKIDKTARNIVRRDCKDRADQDRPASGADEGGNRGSEGADRNAEGTVGLQLIILLNLSIGCVLSIFYIEERYFGSLKTNEQPKIPWLKQIRREGGTSHNI